MPSRSRRPWQDADALRAKLDAEGVGGGLKGELADNRQKERLSLSGAGAGHDHQVLGPDQNVMDCLFLVAIRRIENDRRSCFRVRQRDERFAALGVAVAQSGGQ